VTRALLVSLLLAAWLGASLLFAAAVAPAAFEVLPSRTLAGLLVGRVLPTLFIAGGVIAALCLLLDCSSAGALPLVRRTALAAIIIACGIAQFGIAPRIARVRAQIDGPIEQLAREDPRRVAFGRLHAISVGWLGIAMLAAGTVIVLASISPRGRRSATTASAASSVREPAGSPHSVI
jgi:hypothetical protein